MLHPGGIPFALAGETVVPGIAAGDADGIFEEHSVVSSLRAAPTPPPFYARNERVFCFGPVLAAISASGKPAGASGSIDGECGAVAGLKLLNPFKVRSWCAMPRHSGKKQAHTNFAHDCVFQTPLWLLDSLLSL